MGQIPSSAAASTNNSPSHSAARNRSPKCTAGGSGGDRLLVDVVDALGREFRKQAQQLTELNTLSHEEFQQAVVELNSLSRRCQDAAGKRLLFVVRQASDRTVLWKATVRIACVRVDSLTNAIDTYQMLNLAQFVRIWRTFQAHELALESSELAETERIADIVNRELQPLVVGPTSSSSSSASASAPPDDTDEPLQCCICMDRRADLSLPCTHFYCYPCIEEWKNTSHTCPVCQAVLPAGDESWVLAEPPDVDEVSDRICADLMTLSRSNT